MQYSLAVETQRGLRWVYDRRSVAPPARLDLYFVLVDSPNARRTIAPNRAFAKDVKLAFEANQRALGVNQAMGISIEPYEPPDDDHNCEIGCGHCPICGADAGVR